MQFETHHIPSDGLDLAYDVPADHFYALAELMRSGECDFDGPIAFRLHVVRERDIFTVSGTVNAALRLVCARCLDGCTHRVDSRFALTYSNKIPKDLHRSGSGDLELTAEQIGVLFFEGDVIDLKSALQEQVVFEIPYRPLCSDQCKGLCSGCGANRNRTPCQCDAEALDGPFAVLKNLNLPGE